MSRPVVLSNGELHVGINQYGLVHDFYFPYVGLENHSAGKDLRHRVGVWADGRTSWLDDGSWHVESWTAEGALIGHTRAVHADLRIMLEFDDTVEAEISVFLRNIHVVNLADSTRDIRLFTHQAFAIGDSRSNTDTAQYLPDSDAILHYRGRRAFVISGRCGDRPFDQHSIGLFGIEGREGTYRDADDGELAGSVVEHGRVDSTLRFKIKLGAYDSRRVHYWIAAGTSIREALYVHKSVEDNGLDSYLHATALWWHEWLTPVRAASERLDVSQRQLFIHSAMVVKSHVDKRGAVIASTDSTMLNYSRDAYAYCWPRDGAYALWPLIRLGYVAEPRRFFEFARRGLHQNGYLMHKYQADGALGSSWHPYVHGDTAAPPIQEDETALTLFMFGQYFDIQKDPRLLSEFYESFIKKMGDFLASYVDEKNGLPKPSYDLWEEHFITSTYTVSVVVAALQAAADLAEAAGDSDSVVHWRTAANDIYDNAHKHLFNDATGHFLKGIRYDTGESIRDETIDLSSFFGAYMFGLFPLDSEEIRRSFETIQSKFFQDGSYGLPRYENDDYHRNNQTGTGNYWYIASLWLAQFAQETGDMKLRDAILAWVADKVDGSLMLAEQLNPVTSEALSVSPLVWSHAEYMATLLDIIDGNTHARS
jgi:GH15 family glucan-1,4-alpha-glucosidase